MLLDRLAIAIPLIPLAVWVVALGGPVYAALVGVILFLAAREYGRFFQAGGQRPAGALILAGAPALALSRALPSLVPAVLAAVILAALLWHLIDFERGAPAAGTDFAVTLGGILYLGWMGGYLIELRQAPDGLWWTATVLSGIWLADTAAYAAGRRFGRRPLAPRLSPKKTWEGFAGGIMGSAVGTGVLALVWGLGAGPGSLVDWPAGVLLGAVAGVVGPVGDLGISMLKRQTGVKDSGHVIAGHGGVLDRIDSWLVGVPVGFYGVLLLHAWLR